MHMSTMSELIPTLQIAIAPVILISGVALLQLSMTNRLGRVIDRVRILCRELRSAPTDDRRFILAQLGVLERRAVLIRQAIIWGSVSVLFVALLIFTIFLAALLRWDIGWVLVLLFSGCLISMIVSLVASIRDVNRSLAALKLELRAFAGEPAARG
jgi:hypothetical protein